MKKFNITVNGTAYEVAVWGVSPGAGAGGACGTAA